MLVATDVVKDSNLSSDINDEQFVTARRSWITDQKPPPLPDPVGLLRPVQKGPSRSPVKIPGSDASSMSSKTKHLRKQVGEAPSVPPLDHLGNFHFSR